MGREEGGGFRMGNTCTHVYSILGKVIFVISLSTLNILSHSLLTCNVFVNKSKYILIRISLIYNVSLFLVFKIFSLSLTVC